MKEIFLDGRNWLSVNDVYNAFLTAIGAPSWHGRNFNALRDSIVGGGINKIEVPYSVRITNYASIGPEAKSMAADFIQFIKELRASGALVDIQIEN